MKTLPAYKPRNPLPESYPRSYDGCVAAYGRAPKGYRWLNVGDSLKKGDIHCSRFGEWQYVKFFTAPIYSYTNPVARPIEGTKIVSPLEKLLSRTIFLDRSRGPTKLKPSLKALTDSEVDDGAYSARTVLDLRDALREAIRILEGKKS